MDGNQGKKRIYAVYRNNTSPRRKRHARVRKPLASLPHNLGGGRSPQTSARRPGYRPPFRLLSSAILLRGRRPLYIIAGLLFISLSATWLSHNALTSNLGQTQSRISELEIESGETQREVKRLSQAVNTIDMLYLQVRELRNTSRQLSERLHGIANKLPENGDLTRLPGHVRHIDNQLVHLEQRLLKLGEGFNMAEMQQLIGRMHQRIAAINGQTETLIHHVADSVDAPWPERLLSQFAGRGGIETPSEGQDDWAINLMPLEDRLQAERIARSIGQEGLTVMVDERNQEYHLRVVGFENPGGAREYLLSNLEREVFNGAWLSKWE